MTIPVTVQTSASAHPQSIAAGSITAGWKNCLKYFPGGWRSRLGILALGIFLLSLVNLKSTSSTASHDQSSEISLGEDLLFKTQPQRPRKPRSRPLPKVTI